MIELREWNYAGDYTILTHWLRPQRSLARVVAVRRFKTAPGQRAQVDCRHLGTREIAGQVRTLHILAFTPGYSRRMVAEATPDQKLGTLMRLHEAAYQQIGGVPDEILYDRTKTAWLGPTSVARSRSTRCFRTSGSSGGLRRDCAGSTVQTRKGRWNRK